MNLQKELIRITEEYFNNELDHFNLAKSSSEYKDFLNELCGQDMNIENGRNDIEFNNGKALGTYWAALCIDDLMRTRQFIRGIHKAIEEKSKPLHILYAGTGPFATLILPIMIRYAKEDIEYTFIEVNPLSFEILQKLISKLGLHDYKINFVMADATIYQIDQNNKPDIIISETMQNALAKEQQVSIFLNLMNQVAYKATFIPEKIEISIGLKKVGISSEYTEIKDYHFMGKLFEVSSEAMSLMNLDPSKPAEEITFEKKQITLTEKEIEGFSEILFLTEIQVYKDERIGITQSGLTTPIIKDIIPSDHKGGITINTQYKISAQPELEFEIQYEHKAKTNCILQV